MPVSKESREQLGRALAAAREEAGLTVVQLAQIASPGRAGGLSRYYDAEAGRRMATSETVSHYVHALGRADLQDLRNKILSKRPAQVTEPHLERAAEPVDRRNRPERGRPRALPTIDRPDVRSLTRLDNAPTRPAQAEEDAGDGGDVARPQSEEPTFLRDNWDDALVDAVPQPELLPNSLLEPLQSLLDQQRPLEDGAVVRGREAILAAVCSLMEEAIAICTDENRSVAVQVVQLNPERTFTRNLGFGREQASQFFPYQIQRLVNAGGSVRHLLSYEIMHTLDMWSAFERFIALMELAGDYSAYWASRHQSRARMPDYLIIENVAALEVYPTGALTWAGDAAIVHRGATDRLSVIKDYGENLIAEADEAFQVTDPSSTLAVEQARVWVEHAILDAEQTPAPRFLIKYGFSTLTEPLDSYEERLLATHGLTRDDRASWPTWVKQDLELRRRRLANFLRQIEKHRSIDVVPISALRYYVEHGRYSPDCPEFGRYTVPVEQRIRHLEDVITMLSTNELYDLVVLEDSPPMKPLFGSGILMMGRPDDSEWRIFYQSQKPGPTGEHISVAFETSLDMFRNRVGSRIAMVETEADNGATQSALRLLHHLIAELRESTQTVA